MKMATHSSPTKPVKKPYRSPQLQIYGDLPNITRAVSNMGDADNGNPPTHKTH
jgi:hypothetical protein